MSKLVTVTVRLDQKEIAALDKVAGATGGSRSEVVRKMVRSGLWPQRGEGVDAEGLTSMLERRLFSMIQDAMREHVGGAADLLRDLIGKQMEDSRRDRETMMKIAAATQESATRTAAAVGQNSLTLSALLDAIVSVSGGPSPAPGGGGYDVEGGAGAQAWPEGDNVHL